MDNNIIKQTLLDSFEVLKDSWGTMNDALIKCIVKTEKYDGDMAMNMWLYILQNNEELIHENESLVSDVLCEFREEYNNEFWLSMVEHVVPHLIRNEKLIELIFGQTKNAGMPYYIPYCVAGIILDEKPDLIYKIMMLLSKNKYLIDFTAGSILLKANERIRIYANDKKITSATKEALLSSLDFIKDNKERAECSIAIISFN